MDRPARQQGRVGRGAHLLGRATASRATRKLACQRDDARLIGCDQVRLDLAGVPFSQLPMEGYFFSPRLRRQCSISSPIPRGSTYRVSHAVVRDSGCDPPGGGIGEQLAVPFLVVPGWRVRAVGEIGEAVFRGDPASVTPRRAFNAHSEETAKFGPLPVNELALYSEWPRGSRRSSQGIKSPANAHRRLSFPMIRPSHSQRR
jgi:hypothetical protein